MFVIRQDGEYEEEMLWRKEVREFKVRLRIEDEVDYLDESFVFVVEILFVFNL